MDSVKPSIDHQGMVPEFNVCPLVRSLSDAELFQHSFWPCTSPLRDEVEQEMSIRSQMLKGFNEGLNCAAAAHATDDPLDEDDEEPRPLCPVHVFIMRLRVRPLDPTKKDDPIYGKEERPFPGDQLWFVGCLKSMSCEFGVLPLGFATPRQAAAARDALIAAGLYDNPTWHQRIKVDRDWAGVKRIMLDAIKE